MTSSCLFHHSVFQGYFAGKGWNGRPISGRTKMVIFHQWLYLTRISGDRTGKRCPCAGKGGRMLHPTAIARAFRNLPYRLPSAPSSPGIGGTDSTAGSSLAIPDSGRCHNPERRQASAWRRFHA